MSLPKLNFLEKFLLNCVPDPIPKHLAFIMDGNRRYAKNHDKPTMEGHKSGFNSLKKLL